MSMKYALRSEIVPYPGMGGWHFLSLPKKQASKIKETHGEKAKGWGSIPVTVTLGKSTWKTSIFPDKKAGTYLLPLSGGAEEGGSRGGR